MFQVPPLGGSTWAMTAVLLLDTSMLLAGDVGSVLHSSQRIYDEAISERYEKLIPVRAQLLIWKMVNEKAAIYLNSSYSAGTSLISAALHLLVAYRAPTTRIRNYFILAAASILPVIPIVNSFLRKTHSVLTELSEEPRFTRKDKESSRIGLGVWYNLHNVIRIPYIITWFAGMGAVLGYTKGW